VLVSEITVRKLQHMTGMWSTVIKDSLLHHRPQLSRIAWIKASSACCHGNSLPTTTRFIRYL